MKDSRDTVDTLTNHPTLAGLKARRADAEDDFDKAYEVADEAIALFEEMDRRLREMVKEWRLQTDMLLDNMAGNSKRQSLLEHAAALETFLREFEG